jgi:hypothetical protein
LIRTGTAIRDSLRLAVIRRRINGG